MSKFSLKDLMPTVVQQSENDKPSLIELSLDDIVPNVSNEYGIRDIDELAASIEQVGLLQPIRVKKDNESGKYIIISGERRYTAFCKLAESDNKYRMIPCIVASKKDKYTDELELLIANIQTRELTDYERVYQAQRAKELIESMRRAGADIKGRTRENIALILNTSQTQVARYESIYKKLHPSLMELFRRDEIGVSAAYELSRLPEDEQKEIYSNSALNEINISAVKILSNDNVLSDSSNNDENGVVTLSNSGDMLSEHLPVKEAPSPPQRKSTVCEEAVKVQETPVQDKQLFVNDCENIYKDICDILKRNLKDDTEHLYLMRLMWEAFSEWS